MEQRVKWVTLGEQHGARDPQCLLQQPVFRTYVSDFVSSPDDTDVVGRRNYYCCQHVFISIWTRIINLTQRAPSFFFLFHSSANAPRVSFEIKLWITPNISSSKWMNKCIKIKRGGKKGEKGSVHGTVVLCLHSHLYCLCTINLLQHSPLHFSHESINCSWLLSCNSSSSVR